MNPTTLHAGDYWPLTVLLIDQDGKPATTALADATAVNYALIAQRTKAIVIASAETESGTTGANWDAGIVACPFAADDTAELAEGLYWLEVVVYDASSRPLTASRIDIKVDKAYIASA